MLAEVNPEVNPEVKPNSIQETQPQTPPLHMGMFHVGNAKTLISEASAIATILKDLIERQNLVMTISGKKYVRFEGWQTLAAMLGLAVKEIDTIQTDDITFVARVQVIRSGDGAIIGQASGECGEDWEKKPAFARRSMAQTRAAGKALRLNLAWIISIAGYEPTPAEEMEAIAIPAEKPEQRRPHPSEGGRKISPQQKKLLEARISESGLERDRVKSWMERAFGVQHFHELTEGQFQTILRNIDDWKRRVEEGVDRLTS